MCVHMQNVHYGEALLCVRHLCFIPAPVLCPYGLPGASGVQPAQIGQPRLLVAKTPQKATGCGHADREIYFSDINW